MVLFRKPSNVLEDRIKAIERERRALRDRMAALEAIPDLPGPGPSAPRIRAAALPRSRKAAAVPAPAPVPQPEPGPAAAAPEDAQSLDFEPGPDGVSIKHAAMPRIQRLDMVQPYASRRPATLPDSIGEPEYDRLRNYLGNGGGIHRLHENRKSRGSQRAKAIFMALMVVLLAFILFRMMT